MVVTGGACPFLFDALRPNGATSAPGSNVPAASLLAWGTCESHVPPSDQEITFRRAIGQRTSWRDVAICQNTRSGSGVPDDDGTGDLNFCSNAPRAQSWFAVL